MFNLFYAGKVHKGDKQIFKMKAPRLLSFAGDKKEIEYFLEQPDRGPLLIDSGAFSVAHSGKTIDIDEYIAYINAHPTIEYWIELDKIPFPVLDHMTAKDSAEYSWANYLYMIERVNEPNKILPVFHFGEKLEYLRQILEFKFEDGTGIPYMCIGGRHGVSTKKQEDYFDTIFKTIHASSNPNIKVHCLGMTVLSTLKKFPFFSADSTSHLQYAIYGFILTPFGPVNVSSGNVKGENLRYKTKVEQDIVLAEIEKLGFNLDELAGDFVVRSEYNMAYTHQIAQAYQYEGPKNFNNVLKALF